MDEAFAAELAAMEEVGQRRSRLRVVVAVAAWAAACVVLWSLRWVIGLYIGALYVGIAAALIAGLVAVAIVAKLTPGIIESTATKHNVPAAKLSQTEFIVD